ncbi:MAG: hypothetical protein J6C40_10940 [Lentisphaeria bacterium]|nr:hypothetical protein [Lentisphaeria bacterium]
MKSNVKMLRPAPFWAWNGDLETERLREQIRCMKEMGFGGFFMHSRFGLTVPYMGETWFDAVNAAVDEAGKQGVTACLYDEDRWPSGFAAGAITREHPEWTRCCLECEWGGEPVWDEADLAWFALRLEHEKLRSYRRLNRSEVPETGEVFCRFFLVRKTPQPAYNNENYPDLCNPEVTGRFLALTHDTYRKKMAEDDFQKSSVIFTDEPGYAGFIGKLPWSPLLPDSFCREMSYDLCEHLPELIFEIAGLRISKVRIDYYSQLCRMFCCNFLRPVFDWCEKYGLQLTGHMLGEDDLLSQTQCIGSAMRCYEYMQIPGIDVLGEHWNLYLAAKQCVSVARQQGRAWRLCETCGCTGWDFKFEGYAALTDWLLVLGINFIVPHHFWYSMGGESKRDYPASISPLSPWYREYRKVNDCIARINEAFEGSSDIPRILVIHPIESIWGGKPLTAYPPEKQINLYGYFLHTGSEKIYEQNRLQGITDRLLAEHCDFDYGDEEQLSRIGRVEKGFFCAGQGCYHTVILPELLTVRHSTLLLLESFADQGGTVFFEGEIPEFCDGLPSALPKQSYRKFQRLRPDSGLEKTISVSGENGEAAAVLTRHEKKGEQDILLLCNTSVVPQEDIHNFPAVSERKIVYPHLTVRWKIPADMKIGEIDTMSGFETAVPYRREGEWAVFESSLERLQSRLFMTYRNKPLPQKQKMAGTVIFPTGTFQYRLSEKNLLVLDRAEYSINNGCFEEEDYILNIVQKVRQSLSLPPKGIMACQPYAEISDGKNLPVRLRYSFECLDFEGNVELCLEQPERWSFSLNGVRFNIQDNGFLYDPAIRKIRLPRLKKGKNIIELCGTYDCRTDLESMFLCGDFGVDPQDALTVLPEKLTHEDWTKQGLPYYAGNVTYWLNMECEEKTILDFSHGSGTAFNIRFNDNDTLLYLPPYQFALPPGKHRLEVTVLGSRRNAFGPFYTVDVPYSISSRIFYAYEQRKRNLKPYGLFL